MMNLKIVFVLIWSLMIMMNKIITIISYLLVPFAFIGSIITLTFLALQELEWVDITNMASDIHDQLLLKIKGNK